MNHLIKVITFHQTSLQGRFDFTDVKFEYEPGDHTLEEITFKVKPGQVIALLGSHWIRKIHTWLIFYPGFMNILAERLCWTESN